MAYQVLARKWRPQDFASVVGQRPIVTALRNALTEGRLAQAYLFSGIRGVGKTSVARVLAKALNCERGPASDPCNECAACHEITAGSDLDVIEVDAATYSKVEQVRDLTESLQYGPARDRYKVVVIDEIHRLSRQAFDALLKIVEEPPPHLVFIFATTEIEAVPATILSRCQEYHFRRVPGQEMAAYLRQLAEAEGIAASDTALRLIARAGEGSVRDAVALLDQLATFGSGRIDEEEAARILGGLDAALLLRLLAAVVAGDRGAVREVAAQVEAEGWDPRNVFTQFIGYARDALYLASGSDPAQFDMPLEEARALGETARSAGYENLLRLLHQLLGSEMTVRRSELGSLALEVALLRAAELPKLVRIEELLAGRPAGGPAADAGGTGPGSGQGPAPGPADLPPPAEPAGPGPLFGTPAPAASGWEAESFEVRGNGGPPVLGSSALAPRPPAAQGPLASFLEQVSRRKPPLAAHLGHAEKLDYTGRELLIYTPPGDPWLAQALARPANREVLEAAIAAAWGGEAAWRLVVAKPGGSPVVPNEAPAPAASPSAQHPTVQALLELFGGTVEAGDRREPAADE